MAGMTRRRRGIKGGYARAAALTKTQRVAIARKAGQARWAKWREARANGGKA